MLHAYVQRFDVMGTVEIFLRTKQGLRRYILDQIPANMSSPRKESIAHSLVMHTVLTEFLFFCEAVLTESNTMIACIV